VSDRLRIGLLGALPPAIGGGGAELSVERLAEGLRTLGHDAVRIEALPRDARFDVLHAFTAEPHVWHYLRHWTRKPAPLVITAITVVSPGPGEWSLRLLARLPVPLTGARMRREVLLRADAVVALARYEARLLRSLGIPDDRILVIPGGVDPTPPAQLPPRTPTAPFGLLVGAVSRRKGQAEVVRAVANRVPLAIAGPFVGTPRERSEWEALMRGHDATWLGEVERAAVRSLQGRAVAQVLLSKAETQSLAVLEALSAGTPVVVSDIPSHRELREEWPEFVHLVNRPAEAAEALLELSTRSRRPAGAQPRIPNWREIAGRYVEVYRGSLSGFRPASDLRGPWHPPAS
jgi:glycosyltransferase involved in cell wall biosynthesis